MFFILSKVLLFFTYPLTWILFPLILAFVSRKYRKTFLIIGTVIFLFFSNGFILCEILSSWEGENKDLKLKTYDAVIILGGYSSWNTQRQSLSFNEGSDRLIKGLELYQTGRAEKIILSGGSGLILKPEEKESGLIHELLLDLGVNKNDLILENNSRNTHENAMYTADLLNELNMSKGNYLLITSAFHMNRAEKCFEKTEINFESIRVDYKIDDNDYNLGTYIMPSANTLETWQILIKEWIGYIVYWAKGYL